MDDEQPISPNLKDDDKEEEGDFDPNVVDALDDEGADEDEDAPVVAAKDDDEEEEGWGIDRGDE